MPQKSSNRIQFRLSPSELESLTGMAVDDEQPSITASRLLRQLLTSTTESRKRQQSRWRTLRLDLSRLAVVILNHVGGIDRAAAENWVAKNLVGLDKKNSPLDGDDAEEISLREDLATLLLVVISQGTNISQVEAEAWMQNHLLRKTEG